jgi:hypothetical protein
MLAITSDELRAFAASNGLLFASEDATDRRLKSTNWKIHGDILPNDELKRRQLVFLLFDRLIKDAPFLIWTERDLPDWPQDQLDILRSAFRRGLKKILEVVGHGRGAAAVRFAWSDMDLALIIVFIRTCLHVPGYSDFYIMPEGKRFAVRFDHDDVYTVYCADNETTSEVERKLAMPAK